MDPESRWNSMFKRLNQNFMKLRITLLSCHSTNDLAAAHSRILHLHRCSRPDQTRKSRQNRETLLPIGSLFRDTGPYRDLFANFGPYWVFISSKRSLFLLFWHFKRKKKTKKHDILNKFKNVCYFYKRLFSSIKLEKNIIAAISEIL